MTRDRTKIRKARRCVVKIGSALLTDENKGINAGAITDWVAQAAAWMGPGTVIGYIRFSGGRAVSCGR
jgi:glutamate 5-kinase